MAKFQCLHAGCNATKPLAKGYCSKHYQQFNKYGKTFNATQKDFNETIEFKNHYELILLDNKNIEVGRAKVDKSDLALVKSIGRWYLTDEGYVYNGAKRVMMHRVVMNASDDYEVDHKETGIKNKSDNRKSNLRLSSRLNNSYNQPKRVNNKSGYKGVCYKKSRNKWLAQIRVKTKTKHLGYFETPQEAYVAYKSAAKQLHKDFMHASLNTGAN